jgi:putative tryptophan/tyrosine transport system substrate-binding protein
MMDRRTFLAGTGAMLLAAPLAAEAQSEQKRPRIALLFANTPAADITGPRPVLREARAFLDGMRDLGWLDGQNITIERRSAEGQPDRYAALVQEVMGLHVDLVVTGSGFVKLIKQTSDTMPVVVAGGDENALVQQGVVASLARPGGTVTGLLFNPGPDLGGKQLQLLKEAVPKASRVAYLASPSVRPPTEAARALRLTLVSAGAAAPEALDSAFAAIKQQRVDAILVGTSPFFYGHRLRIIDFAARQRLPAMYWYRLFADSGGLMSYGAEFVDLFQRAATYVDKILKGANPGDLPIERPTKFALVINLKTAKALGLTIPPSLLARADEVLQ